MTDETKQALELFAKKVKAVAIGRVAHPAIDKALDEVITEMDQAKIRAHLNMQLAILGDSYAWKPDRWPNLRGAIIDRLIAAGVTDLPEAP